MSMPAWPNDVPTVANNDNGTFDPSMAFMQTPTSSNFDFNPLPNQQFQQRMQNGSVRNASPAFHNGAYQTQPTIPAKRPRAGGDSYGASPGQHAGGLPASRSQTPQQGPYPGFHGNANGSQQVQPPTPYQHLQQGGSSNASPSPTLQDPHFNPQAIPQRMQTASPSPFSSATQNFVPQASPPRSDYGSRVDNLQNGVHPYGQGMVYGGPPMQNLTPPPGSAYSGNHGNMQPSYAHNPAQFQQQQRLYELRQQEMVRRLAATNNAAQHRHQGSGLNPAAGTANQMASYQQAVRAQQMQTAMPRSANPEQFIQSLAQLMHQRGMPFNPNPAIGGRPLHITQLYSIVMKYGGSKKATASGSWPAIAAALQFHPVQYPTAAQEIQGYWNANLALYEQMFWQNQQQQQQQQQQRQRSMNLHPSMTQPTQGESPMHMRDQYSPVKQLGSQAQDASTTTPVRRESAGGHPTPTKRITPQPSDARQTQVNGFSTPQPTRMQNQQQNAFPPQAMLALPQQATPTRAQQASFRPSAATSAKTATLTVAKPVPAIQDNPLTSMPRLIKRGPVYQVLFRDISNYETDNGGVTHGGVNVGVFEKATNELEKYRPDVPKAADLGVVDLRALTMSLRCGIHSEVRLALDTMAALCAPESRQAGPEASEDLIEALVECADEQVELLAENAAEVSDVMLISPYEDVVRGCVCETETLQEIHEFGTVEYDLDRAVERLICVTTVIRNLSFSPANFSLLADPDVVKFMTTVIRYLGTRNMLLRTYRNTLDFAKDIVMYLNNVSQAIELPGKEEALCILHFLISFAPCPPPTVPGNETVMFSGYIPAIHRYLPPAVDSLAKILTRDEPNRVYYRSIFAADGSSSPPYDLLTRAFALAIAPLPTNVNGTLEVVKARRPYLAQGFLAAEILVTLIPTAEHSLARSWLTSQDGFSKRLLRLVSLMSIERPPIAQVHPSTRQTIDPDPETYGMITNHAIALLRKLADKAKDTDSLDGGLPLGILPKRSTLLEVLKAKVIDTNVLQQICSYAQLES